MKLARINAASWEAFAGDSNMVLQHGTRPVLVIFKLYLVHRSPYSTQASETRPSTIHTCCVTCKCFPAVCINLGKLHMSPSNILIQADCLADRPWSHCKPSNKMYFYVESLFCVAAWRSKFPFLVFKTIVISSMFLIMHYYALVAKHKV